MHDRQRKKILNNNNRQRRFSAGLGLCIVIASSTTGHPAFANSNDTVRETAIRQMGALRGIERPAAETVTTILPSVSVGPVARKGSLASGLTRFASRHPDRFVEAPRNEPRTAATKVTPQAPVTAIGGRRPIVSASATTRVELQPSRDPAVPVVPVPTPPVDTVPTDPVTTPVIQEQDAAAEPELFVLVLVGDTGLNAHNQKVRPAKAIRHGRGLAWDWTTRKIAPLIDGHVNFANIETVVTDHNKHYPSPKSFNFRMHANGARHLVDVGFNVFSLANNHSADYGRNGVRDTLKHSERLRSAGLRAYAGLGLDRDSAIESQTFSIGSARFGFAAMGIGARQPGPSRAGEGKPGQVNIYGKDDFNAVVDHLVDAPADFRILSLHFGAERNVRPLPGQVKKWRDEVQIGRNVDLIVGHHAHVVQGVQMTDGKLIFYGLGNFLHMGMQDMSKFNACRDYGLLARVFVVRQPDGTMEAQAVQVVPLTDMHVQARPHSVKSAGRRIDVLNMLAEELDDTGSGSQGVRFAKQPDGSGLFCRPGAGNGPGRLGALCTDYSPAPAFTKAARRRVRGLCSFSPRVASRKKSRTQRASKRKKRRRKAWTGRDVFNSNR